MFRQLSNVTAIGGLAACALLADFSYEQTARVTGGMAAMASRYTGQAAEPVTTSVMVKGNRMASVTKGRATIIDLDAETFTEIDHTRKTYTVTTFARMKEMMESMTQAKDGAAAFKVNAKETGQSKQIAGYTAKELVVTVEFEAKDPASGKAAPMTMTNNVWLAAGVAGYAELRAFHEKMAAKVPWAQGGEPGPGGAEMARGMAEIQKQMAKVEGVPILSVMKTTGKVDGQSMPQLTPGQQAQLNDAQKQMEQALAEAREEQARASKNAPEESTRSSIAGALGGRLPGGFGGFGRKKKTAEPPPQASAPPPAAAPAKRAAGAETMDASGALMEMTMESKNFSAASVDAAKFEVPAGFKKADSR